MKNKPYQQDNSLLFAVICSILILKAYNFYLDLSVFEFLFASTFTFIMFLAAFYIWYNCFSKYGKAKAEKKLFIKNLPTTIKEPNDSSVYLGYERDLNLNIYLPDPLRSKHVHILGATGSGKTESVILNFIKQDVQRGLGAIILDAKGDDSFLKFLNKNIPTENLRVFDLSSKDSMGYNPLEAGSPLESAQRLFSSLNWSEEYYKSKSLSALQGIYQYHVSIEKKNPTLNNLAYYLEDPERFSIAMAKKNDKKSKETYRKDYESILGLKDQINLLNIGYLKSILSPNNNYKFSLEEAYSGNVLYFRLQSLISPQLVSILGRLIINNLNYLAGTAHRNESNAKEVKLIPTYLDEFASFACPEFADLISKARSAGLALHFSHQSIGDLSEVSKGFINKITDNSATKIVLRINDPDSAEYMARSFGTKIYTKITQRVTNSEDASSAKNVGEGSVREAHQYRASPDLLKTLPTGTGSVLIAHGEDTEGGGSCVLKIKFPRLTIN